MGVENFPDSEVKLQQDSAFKFSIASLMILMAVFAVMIRWPQYLYFLAPLFSLVVIYMISRRQVEWANYCSLLGAVYIPSLQGFFASGSHCRNSWPELFPVASGLIPTVLVNRFLGINRLQSSIELSIAAVWIFVVISLAYWLMSLGGRLSRSLVLLTLFSGSTVSSAVLVAALHA